MRRRQALAALLGTGILLGFVITTLPAAAAKNVSTTGVIGVSPALQNLVAQPGQQTLAYQVTVTNNSAQDLPITVTTSDFTAFGTNGTPVFLGAGHYNGNYSLAKALIPASNAFTLPAHGSRQLDVQLRNPAGLAGGGHYGAVLFETAPGANPVANNKNRVSLKQTVASLVFLTTSGQGSYHLQLARPAGGLRLFSLPSELNLLFTNTGNVQTTPLGYVNLTNPFGKQVAKTVLNPNTALVLPGTKRLLQMPLSGSSHPVWPGIYSAQVFYRPDGSAVFTLSTTRFFYVGWPALILVIFVFILAALIVKNRTFSIRKK